MERYSFFNAVVGEAGQLDREYLAEDFARYFASFIGNGVYAKPASSLQVNAKENMSITINAGKAWINGYFYELTEPKTLTLDLADGTTERIDRIIIKLDLVERKITTEIKKGMAGVKAIEPSLQRDSNIFEMSLADIKIYKNMLSITQGDVKDQRFNNEVCGIVSGVVDQIDTEGLFVQYDKQFNDWFNKVKDLLSTTPVGNLQSEIDKVAKDNALGIQKIYDDSAKTAEEVKNTVKSGTLVDALALSEFYKKFVNVQSYTPELTKTNGHRLEQVVNYSFGEYIRIGKLVFVTIAMKVRVNESGEYAKFSLPVKASSAHIQTLSLGECYNLTTSKPVSCQTLSGESLAQIQTNSGEQANMWQYSNSAGYLKVSGFYLTDEEDGVN